jgi:hypothetical protein
VKSKAVNGVLCCSGGPTLPGQQDPGRAQQAADLFNALNQAGTIG